MLGSEQGSSSKHWKKRQGSLAHLLQHLISGEGSAFDVHDRYATQRSCALMQLRSVICNHGQRLYI
jgi:hypothetical protein